MAISMATRCSKGIPEFGLLWGAEKGNICTTENIKAQIQTHNRTKIQSTKKHDTSTEVDNILSLNDATKHVDASIRQYLSLILKVWWNKVPKP